MIAIEKGYAPYLIGLLLSLVALSAGTIFGAEMRTIMWTKVAIISSAFIVIPRLNLGPWRQTVILIISIIVIARFGAMADEKGLAVISIVIALLLVPSQRGRYGLLIASVLMMPLLLVQDEVGSRALLVTVAVFFAQTVALRFFRRPFLIWASPLAYPVIMAILGYSFIFGFGLVSPSVSNLARTTMIYTIASNIVDFPFGYADPATYYYILGTFAEKLYSATYNDPHNLFMTAIVWGGIPLLLASALAFYFGPYRAAAANTNSFSAVLAASAICVFSSTSTLSFSNVLFLFLLLLHLSPNARKLHSFSKNQAEIGRLRGY